MKISGQRSLNGRCDGAHEGCAADLHADVREGTSLSANTDEQADAREAQMALRLLEIQRDLALGLLSCANLIECLDLLLAWAMRLPGFDCGGIYLCENTGGLRLIAHRGLSETFAENATSYPADSPQARLVRSGKLAYFYSVILLGAIFC